LPKTYLLLRGQNYGKLLKVTRIYLLHN